jgi:hypothetical protein
LIISRRLCVAFDPDIGHGVRRGEAIELLPKIVIGLTLLSVHPPDEVFTVRIELNLTRLLEGAQGRNEGLEFHENALVLTKHEGTGEGIEVPLLNLINRIARLADQPGG